MHRAIFVSILGLAVALLAAGCGGGKSGGSSLAPVQPAGSQGSSSHSYIGTQSTDSCGQYGSCAYGGTWGITFDDSTKYFSYENFGHEGYQGANLIGSWVFPLAQQTAGSSSGSGFMSLSGTIGNTGAAGYALEVPGETALLRPGTSATAPVVSVVTNGCPSVSSATTYQFISFGTPLQDDPNKSHVAYGSLQASSSGTVWSFSNLSMYSFAGTALTPTALPNGNCDYTQLGYAVTIGPSTATSNLTETFAVSPNGYFILDQGQGEPFAGGLGVPGVTPSIPSTGPIGLVGVQQPSSAIDTGSLVGAKYLGIEYDPVDISLKRPASLPVSFGQTAGAGTVMFGGAYPNDDLTQTPPANISIDLGQQDAKNNGLYPSVTVTVPDTYAACASTPFGGTDATGNSTCIFHGVAVAGKPNGKFVLFVTVNDVSLAVSHYTADAALDFFLYQQ